MKNLYNTIEQNLKAGLHVVVKDLKDGYCCYCSISNYKDEYGNYRMSVWYNSIEISKQWIGRYNGWSKKDWDNKDLEIVEVYRPEFEPFKIGDEVRILDKIKETDDWGNYKDSFPEMRGKIEGVYNWKLGKHYKVNGWYVGHEFLAPLVEEEVEEEVEELTLSEVCKLLGREVKIKK